MKAISDFSFTMKAYNLEMQRIRGGTYSILLRNVIHFMCLLNELYNRSVGKGSGGSL